MNTERTVFSQLVEFLPHQQFQNCVDRYGGGRYLNTLPCWGSVSGDGIRSVDLPQESSQPRSLPRFHRRQALPHGIPRKDSTFDLGRCERSSRLANLADFAQVLIAIARPLYALDPIGVDLDQSLYTLDSTTIDLCLALFPWAKFRKHKAAVKMHTLLDLRGPHVYPCPCGEPA
jgi:Domain of unknown function (DUF4372)